LGERSPFEILSEAGIDLEERKISKNFDKRMVVFFLDDAQNKYGDAGSFWEQLRKVTGIWFPANVIFVISANHALSGGKDSPVSFDYLSRVRRIDFLLIEEEAFSSLNSPILDCPKTSGSIKS